jgi:hypothetical protein
MLYNVGEKYLALLTTNELNKLQDLGDLIERVIQLLAIWEIQWYATYTSINILLYIFLVVLGLNSGPGTC